MTKKEKAYEDFICDILDMALTEWAYASTGLEEANTEEKLIACKATANTYDKILTWVSNQLDLRKLSPTKEKTV